MRNDFTEEEAVELAEDSAVQIKLQQHITALSAQKSMTLKRSTFNEKVARQMLPFFEAALSTSQRVVIPYAAFPMNQPGTVYKKVCDGLRFLIIQAAWISSSQRAKLVQLRTTWRFIQENDGVYIIPYRSRRNVPMDVGPDYSWRNDLYNWLDSDMTKPFIRTGLSLTNEDIELVKTLTALLKCTLILNEKEIRILNESNASPPSDKGTA